MDNMHWTLFDITTLK